MNGTVEGRLEPSAQTKGTSSASSKHANPYQGFKRVDDKFVWFGFLVKHEVEAWRPSEEVAYHGIAASALIDVQLPSHIMALSQSPSLK
jgi:hypothetical protein